MDVKLVLNSKEILDIELQLRNEHNWPERSLLYWSRAYDSIREGHAYKQLKKTYHIGILDFTLFTDNPAFYAEYMVLKLKELSEDEKIRQQCQAREDYERRLVGEYSRGQEDGIQQGTSTTLVDLVNKGIITVEISAEQMGVSVEEFKKLIK